MQHRFVAIMTLSLRGVSASFQRQNWMPSFYSFFFMTSLDALKYVKIATPSAAIDENFVKMIIFLFQGVTDIWDVSPVDISWCPVVVSVRVEVGASRFTAVAHITELVYVETMVTHLRETRRRDSDVYFALASLQWNPMECEMVLKTRNHGAPQLIVRP